MVAKINVLQQAVSARLHEAAKKNRSHLTEAEDKLWQYLRRRQTGWKFRRQQVIDHFIVDFYCHEAKLVIEVDGNYHVEDEQAALDGERERFLAGLGLRVLRFSNEQVLSDPAFVLAKIEAACEKT